MKHAILGALVASAFAIPTAQAGFLGSSATFEYYVYGGAYDQGGSPTTFTVDGVAGASFLNPTSAALRYFDILVTDNRLVFDFQDTGSWSPSPVSLNSGGLYIESGPLMSFSGATPIQTVSIDPDTNMTGLVAANITHDASRIAVNWEFLSYGPSTQVVLNVTFAPPVPVPEPSAIALTSLGLGGLVLALRRRRRD